MAQQTTSAAELFDGLDGSAIDDVYRSMRQRRFEAGRTVFRAGDAGDSLFLLQRGLIDVVAEEGGAVLGRQHEGEIFGEIALLTGEPRSVTLVARVGCDVLELSRSSFDALAERFPALLKNLARILAERLVTRTAELGWQRPSEAVALVMGGEGSPRPEELLTAAQAASPRPVTGIDLTGPERLETGLALEQVERTLREHGTVLLFVRPDDEDLPILLGYADWSHVVAADSDVGWIGRHVTRTKLGLALGAGGAKGFAHVGVIRALEQAGYGCDYVAGSSIGALVAAWLALGWDGDRIEATLRAQYTPDAVDALFRHGAAGDPSGLDVLRRIARETTAERTFESLAVPLTIMAADLEGRRPAAITTGPIHEALVAAMSVPGLYPPVAVRSQRLVDAVVLTPVPTAALVTAGADVTIAVNLLGRDMLEAWPGSAPEVSSRPRGGRDTIIESLEVAQIGASARKTALADVPITPLFGPGTWRHFHLADQFMAAGAAAAEAALPALRSLARPRGA